MKRYFKLANAPYLVLAILLFTMACKKDKSTEEPVVTNTEKIAGTWQRTDGDYSGTITFEAGSLLAHDYFTDDTLAGVGMFEWRLNEDQLTLTLISQLGDYESYNNFTPNSVINAVVGITSNELTLNIGNETYVYTRLAPEKIVDKKYIEGTWETVEGDYRGLITYTLSPGTNIGVHAFTANADSGAVNIQWGINGNMIYLSRGSSPYGAYRGHHGIIDNSFTIAKLNTTNNQLIITVNGDSSVYTRYSSDKIVSKSDLLGPWKRTDGSLHEVITFNLINNYGPGNAEHYFIDGNSKGFISASYWTVSGDLFAIRHQGDGEDDYGSYYGIPRIGSAKVRNVSYSNNQITFSDYSKNYTYTRVDTNEVIKNSDLIGRWTRTDATYSDTLTFDGDNTMLHSFTDGTQSGTSEIYYSIHGDIFLLTYFSMTGDYETYHGYAINENNYSLIELIGNQLTVNNDGVDYIYTKQP